MAAWGHAALGTPCPRGGDCECTDVLGSSLRLNEAPGTSFLKNNWGSVTAV